MLVTIPCLKGQPLKERRKVSGALLGRTWGELLSSVWSSPKADSVASQSQPALVRLMPLLGASSYALHEEGKISILQLTKPAPLGQ